MSLNHAVVERVVRWSLLVVVASSLLGGCGGDGGSRTSSRAATKRPHATSPRPRDASRRDTSDRALAGGALLQLVDMPSEWGEAPQGMPDLRCGSADPFRGAVAVVATNRFVYETIGIQETIGVFRDEAASGRAFARINSRPALRCLRRNVRQDMVQQAGAPVARPQLMRAEALGPSARAIRYVAEIANDAGPMHGYIDAVHLRVGRAVGALVIAAGLEPASEELYERVVARMTSRLQRALA
jgi:hypothetical protein